MKLNLLADPRRVAAPVAYAVVALFMSTLLREYGPKYLSPMAGPLFDTPRGQDYAIDVWLVAALLYWVPRLGVYVFAGVNALLLSNAYFALILRFHFDTFDDIVIYLAPIAGVSALAMIRRTSLRDILIFNALVFLSALPLAAQYAIIAARPA